MLMKSCFRGTGRPIKRCWIFLQFCVDWELLALIWLNFDQNCVKVYKIMILESENHDFVSL